MDQRRVSRKKHNLKKKKNVSAQTSAGSVMLLDRLSKFTIAVTPRDRIAIMDPCLVSVRVRSDMARNRGDPLSKQGYRESKRPLRLHLEDVEDPKSLRKSKMIIENK